MYIRVKLLNGYREALTYQLPDSYEATKLVGTIIEVPLQKRTEAALVEAIFSKLEEPVSYTIRTTTGKEIVPSDPHYSAFIKKLSSYYALNQLQLLKRIRGFLQEKEHTETVFEQKEIPEHVPPTLTDEQQTVVDALVHAIDKGVYYPALLQGVTGSGKTEIYKQLIIHATRRSKSTLFLLPEVALAVQFSHILKNQLPQDIPLYSFHSATSMKQKRALWQRLLNNLPTVIIGVHLPVLLPIGHLGLIIVDEEHEIGFQEKKHPKINTKEAALLRAQLSSIPLLAGSATPSVTSLYNVKHRGWHFFELKKRFAGAFPRIDVVKLTDSKPRKHFWISNPLKEAITQQLIKKEQTIIFLNRRGYSFFIQCKACGFIPHCKYCSVSLTLHNNAQMLCHYCTFSFPMPEACTSCKATVFLKKGIGTQQIVTILEKLFPQARVARADLDSTINKKKWRETMQAFEEGKFDILVGTQTITKGYHFPRVTLVGIIWADMNLGLPVYNAAEVSLQQLIQVSGRAGRQSPDSRVIVQTMIDHPIFKYLNEQDYTSFYNYEYEKRRLVQYPPCIRLAEIELKHEDEEIVAKEAHLLATSLKQHIEKNSQQIILLGPSQPPVQMIKKVFSRKIYIKSQTIAAMINAYTSINKAFYKSSIFFTPNPAS